MKRVFLILIFTLVFNTAYAQHRSYNDRYYGYGLPLAPIKTPKKWMPYRKTPKADYYQQFGYGNGFNGPNQHWFSYWIIIEY